MISFGNFGTGKILYSSLKVHCKSPHSWPSSCGKKQFLHSRLRRSWRNCFSPRLLTHSWGDLQCTFRDSQKILNSYTRGFATRIGIFQSQNCQMISLGQCYDCHMSKDQLKFLQMRVKIMYLGSLPWCHGSLQVATGGQGSTSKLMESKNFAKVLSIID